MSGNHGGSLNAAHKIIEEVAKTGVDAIKLQTYTADTMTINIRSNEFSVEDKNSLWFGRSLYDLYSEAATPWEWHEELFSHAKSLGLIAFSTPFDETAVDFLESLNVPCYKIASFENTDLELIKKVARTGKPIIISTGMSTVAEISESVITARENGCSELVLLKCTSSYPAEPKDINLKTIPHMKELFGCEIGLSDHTLGIGVAVASVAFGASVIEKHVTLDRNDGKVDSEFSMVPEELKKLVSEARIAQSALGKIKYGASDSENQSFIHRRSIYVVEDIREGEIFTMKNIRAIRPGLGLPIKFINEIIGKRVNCDITKGTPLSWKHIG